MRYNVDRRLDISYNDRLMEVIYGFIWPKQNKEEKHDEKLQQFIKEYKLEDLDRKSTEEIFQASEVMTKSYFSTLVKQNVIIIKQLNKLNENIERLLNK